MKILMVNKFLFPKGGAETYVFKLGQILEEHNHSVQYFGIYDENNIVGNSAGAYVSPQDFQKVTAESLTAPFKIIYSSQARRKIRKVLDDFQPDIVHLNNIQFHLTPSIILEIQKYKKETKSNVKIVYTAHDYQLVCPNHSFIDNDFKICEKCLGGNYMHCVKTKCIKNSYPKSILGAADAYLWKHNKAYSYVDTIICPSAFLKSKLDAQKRFADKTVAIHNFVDIAPAKAVEKQDYVLYFGRLCRDKGVYTLLDACRKLPEIKFVFAGSGPAEEDVAKLSNAEYVGFKTGEELEMLIRKAKFTVCPSVWHENCPFSVIESQMYLTPVIGSTRGGIPEIIRPGETGELFEAENSDDLADKIKKLWYNPRLLAKYTENCKTLDIETPESYYNKLLKIYCGGM